MPAAPVATRTLDRPLFAGDVATVEALTPPGEALLHELGFTLGAGATELTLGAAWVAGQTPLSLVGLDISLIDKGGATVASDTFQGLFTGGSAISSFDVAGLAQGDYILRVTGVPSSVATYDLFLEVGGTPPAPVPLPASGLLLAAAMAGFSADAAQEPSRPAACPRRIDRPPSGGLRRGG